MRLSDLRSAIQSTLSADSRISACSKYLHGGDIDLDELKVYARNTPAVILALAGMKGLFQGGERASECMWALFVACEDKGDGAGGVYGKIEQTHDYVDAILRILLTFGQRWGLSEEGVGPVQDVVARNLYSRKLDDRGVSLWGVSWKQQIDLADDTNLAVPLTKIVGDWDLYPRDNDADLGDVIDATDDVFGNVAAQPATYLEIFGPFARGGAYIANEPWIELTVDDVDAWHNAHGPDRPLASLAPPKWLPAGGVDSRGSVQFDGLAEYMAATGLDWSVGDQPCMLLVHRYNDVSNVVGYGFVLARVSGTDDHFIAGINTNETIDEWQNVLRFSGTNLITFHGAPEVDGSDVPHLSEGHIFDTDGEVLLDGVVVGAGGNSAGLNVARDRLVLGARWNGSSYHVFAAVEVSECAIIDSATRAQLANLRSGRIALLYPSIPLP